MTGHVGALGSWGAAWSGTVTSTAEPVLPEPVEGVDPADVTPGLVGFLVTFAVVLACIPLFLSMTGKLRRVSRRPVPGADDGEVGADESRRAAERGTDPRGSAQGPGSTGS